MKMRVPGILLGFALSAGAEPPPVPERGPVWPIVVTASGIRFEELGVGLELRHILKLLQRVFPDIDVSSAYVEELDSPRPLKVPIPENYLETDLRTAALRNGILAEIVHFSWSQDPEESARWVVEFKRRLLALQAGSGGRPIHIAAHSWGSVLMHQALNELEREGRPVEVRRFVSMGSPLVPRRLLTRVVRDAEAALGRLQKTVVKPKSVRRWVNLWAENDLFSGPIAAADENLRVDMAVEPYEKRLKALLASAPDKKAVRRDLKTLKDPHAWHESYHYGIYAELPTLGETLSWNVLQDHVMDVLPAQ